MLQGSKFTNTNYIRPFSIKDLQLDQSHGLSPVSNNHNDSETNLMESLFDDQVTIFFIC